MDQKEKKLMNIILALFMEKGPKFRIEDVAKQMKISKKTIYKDYGNKEELILLVVKAIFEGIERQLQIIIDSDDLNPVEKLIKLTCTFPDAKDIDYHDAMLLADDFPRAYEVFYQYIEGNWSKSKMLFDEAVDQGLIRAVDYDLYRNVTMGITKQVLASEEPDKEKQLEASIRLVFDGIRTLEGV